jgi:hypothetical protein
MFMQGANVDVSSGDMSIPNICIVNGSFTDPSAISSNYSACSWTEYLEGSDANTGAAALANTGYIVRDIATLSHHYKWQVVDNAGSEISFKLLKID